MNVWARVRRLWHTAVADLFSEETATAVPDRVVTLIHDIQHRLDELHNELALALARARRAETAWQVAQAQNLPEAPELEAHYQTLTSAINRLQTEIDHLQTRLTAIESQTAYLKDREESITMLERLQTLQKELDKTAVTLHHDLADRQEQVARREDNVAAREEVRRRKL